MMRVNCLISSINKFSSLYGTLSYVSLREMLNNSDVFSESFFLYVEAQEKLRLS